MGRLGFDATTWGYPFNGIVREYDLSSPAPLKGKKLGDVMFEVHLYCNGVRVGDAIYRRQHTHAEIEQETGACLNLLNGAIRPAGFLTNTFP